MGPPPSKVSTFSLHDALPISRGGRQGTAAARRARRAASARAVRTEPADALPSGQHRLLDGRSEEHTSELQSRRDLVCRLLLEKKNKNNPINRLGLLPQ